MTAPFRILYLEDDPVDARLVQETLKRTDLSAELIVVDGREKFEAALNDQGLNLILSDYHLPVFDGEKALALSRDRRVGVLHGGMRQGARLQALREFEEKRTPILIATNLASRGLDLPEISHVINFDMPEDVETYIHRVGRTARMGRAGTAITFVGQFDLEIFDQLKRNLGSSLKRHPLNLYS